MYQPGSRISLPIIRLVETVESQRILRRSPTGKWVSGGQGCPARREAWPVNLPYSEQDTVRDHSTPPGTAGLNSLRLASVSSRRITRVATFAACSCPWRVRAFGPGETEARERAPIPRPARGVMGDEPPRLGGEIPARSHGASLGRSRSRAAPGGSESTVAPQDQRLAPQPRRGHVRASTMIGALGVSLPPITRPSDPHVARGSGGRSLFRQR
jgi:hypothetical protein